MSALRDEIRAILREEIAAIQGATPAPQTEQVRVTSSSDLNRFAQDLARRMADPGFAAQVAQGNIRFELAGVAPAPSYSAPIVAGPTRTPSDVLEKSLITERDIAGLGTQSRSLCIGKNSRLTPLARDEARRRGIRIERTKA